MYIILTAGNRNKQTEVLKKMFSNLLQKGYAIKISKDGYTATTFRIIDNKVHFYNEELGDGVHGKFSENIFDFDNHICNMLEENFIITIF